MKIWTSIWERKKNSMNKIQQKKKEKKKLNRSERIFFLIKILVSKNFKKNLKVDKKILF